MPEMTDVCDDSKSADIKAHAAPDASSLSDEVRRLDNATLRRLDGLLLPLTLMLYLLAWLDRANVGNARVVSCRVYLQLATCRL